MRARSVLLALVLALALTAPASAQDTPSSLWDSAPAPDAVGTSHDGGRSAVLLALGLVALAAAGGVALLAVRAPAMRPPATPSDDPSRNGSTPAASARFAPGPERDRHPLPVAAPPPRPAFGPGSSSAPPAAPPPPPPPHY